MDGGPTVTTVLHICLGYASYFPTYLPLLANFCSRQSSSSHLDPQFCKVLFLHSLITTWFCHYSKKTSIPPWIVDTVPGHKVILSIIYQTVNAGDKIEQGAIFLTVIQTAGISKS